MDFDCKLSQNKVDTDFEYWIKDVDYGSNYYLYNPFADFGISDDVFKLSGFKTESLNTGSANKRWNIHWFKSWDSNLRIGMNCPQLKRKRKLIVI